jgi:hypothetical protein
MNRLLQAESRQILTSQIVSIAKLGAEISDSGKKLKLEVRRNRFAIFCNLVPMLNHVSLP